VVLKCGWSENAVSSEKIIPGVTDMRTHKIEGTLTSIWPRTTTVSVKKGSYYVFSGGSGKGQQGRRFDQSVIVFVFSTQLSVVRGRNRPNTAGESGQRNRGGA